MNADLMEHYIKHVADNLLKRLGLRPSYLNANPVRFMRITRLADLLCRSHIFDGENLTSYNAAFQLCDLHDPMLKEMVEDDEDLREECDVSLCDVGL